MKMLVIVVIVVSTLARAAAVEAQETTQDPPAAQRHVDAAKALAGTRFAAAMTRLCSPPNARSRPTFSETAIEPVRLFDNLYFLGLANVYAWALDTPDGIIVLDTLNNAKDAELTIIGGMKKLGLDPARIKYVFISHAHADHFGGAPYLKEHFGARVMASDASWREMEQIQSTTAPPPARDVVLSDGQTLTLGGTTLTFVLTPGHTPGTVSVILPVTDRGQPHVAIVVSGPRTENRQSTTLMLASTEKLASLAKTARVDIELANHSYVDDSLPVIEAIRKRKPQEPNAYVIGQDGVQRFLGWQAECLKADIARSETDAPGGGR